MPDLDHAKMMLAIARKDFQALQAMLDEASFAEEIFGFHAQQAVEKALRAWLSYKDISYPRIHDLEEIVVLLKEGGETFPEKFAPLIDLTDFAVFFRFEAYEVCEARLDRPAIIQQIAAMLEHIADVIAPVSG